MGMDKTDGTLDLVGSGDATGAGMTVSDADGWGRIVSLIEDAARLPGTRL